MPYRTVKPRSDRGSIKDLANGETPYEPPTQEELRLKELYEIAETNRDQQLKNALGFIVMPYGKDISPVSVYRHREYVQSLSAEAAEQIEKMKQELSACFNPGPIHKQARMQFFKKLASSHAILEEEPMIKVAGTHMRAHAHAKSSFKRSI